MNMHGIIKPIAPPPDKDSWWTQVVVRAKGLRWFLAIVIAPTLLTAAYFYLVASDQYETEAHFLVNSGGSNSGGISGVGQLLGLSAGGGQSQGDVMSVPDYLSSHDAVAALQKQLDIVSMFRRPGTDLLSRLRRSDPSPESLLSYYHRKVSVHFDRDTGIATLKVRAFRPADAYQIASKLLQLGEDRVNRMNERSYNDSISGAERQMANAETAVGSIQHRMTAYRQAQADIDPQVSGENQIRLVSTLSGELAQARAQLAAMGAAIGHNSPQYIALQRQVASLGAEVARQSGELAGRRSDNIATSLGGFEDLKVRQEFAGKQYEAAASNLEKAREEARRQQLYVVRVVDPNVPVKSEFPERGKIVSIVFIALLLIYSVGWLILAGVREHAV